MPTFNFNIIFDAFYGILVYLNHFFLNSITFDFGSSSVTPQTELSSC